MCYLCRADIPYNQNVSLRSCRLLTRARIRVILDSIFIFERNEKTCSSWNLFAVFCARVRFIFSTRLLQEMNDTSARMIERLEESVLFVLFVFALATVFLASFLIYVIFSGRFKLRKHSFFIVCAVRPF